MDKEQLQKRLEELQKEYDNIQKNALRYEGAIQQVQWELHELEHAEMAIEPQEAEKPVAKKGK